MRDMLGIPDPDNDGELLTAPVSAPEGASPGTPAEPQEEEKRTALHAEERKRAAPKGGPTCWRAGRGSR